MLLKSEFFRVFKDSPCLKKLTNLDTFATMMLILKDIYTSLTVKEMPKKYKRGSNLKSSLYTDSIKINHPEYNIGMYWTNFWQPSVYIHQNIFEKTIIEVCNSHLYASFGNFCDQIGQLFEAQWLFVVLCLKIDKSLSSKQNVVEIGILPSV